jgi:hypothetical protein
MSTMTLCEPLTMETYTARGSYAVNKPAFLSYNSKYDIRTLRFSCVYTLIQHCGGRQDERVCMFVFHFW